MKKRYWLTGTIVAAVMLLGIMGGVAMAQETDDEDGDSTKQSFAARVAEILGLDETTVQDAMDEAKAEMKEEALQAKLDWLVENGHMTQEQADEYKTWIESKPEGLSPKMFGGFGKKRHRFGGRGWGGGGKSKPSVDSGDSA